MADIYGYQANIYVAQSLADAENKQDLCMKLESLNPLPLIRLGFLRVVFLGGVNLTPPRPPLHISKEVI